MKTSRNPFAPGAGTLPPALAGREDIRAAVRVALERARLGHPERGVMMIGLRGVGKTVLLKQLRENAAADGVQTIFVESPENKPLPDIIAPELRTVLLGMSRGEQVRQALSALGGFAKAFKVRIGDIGLEWQPGVADNGNLEQDLKMLMEKVGAAARAEKTAIALFIDELQYVEESALSALCAAFHWTSSLPVLPIGAGLPQLLGQLGRAKSYAERLFEFTEIGALSAAAADCAIAQPMLAEGVKINKNALREIVKQTRGYPYFLQEWGKHVWNTADASPITIEHVHRASELAVAALDGGFFRVRFDRLTPTERRYLRAMAELGGEFFRSSDIAEVLQKGVTQLAPIRAKLIHKGMAYSPAHGDIAFTVPLFGDFMKRIMPGDWRV